MADEWGPLYDLARSLNQYVAPERLASSNGAPAANLGERPGDDFNARACWEDVLRPHGWTVAGRCGATTYWRRPGKEDRGWSATTGHCKSDGAGDLLYVFSTSAAPLEDETAYSKFSAYTLLAHGGDFGAAARACVAAGYGTPSLPAGRIVVEAMQASADAQQAPIPFALPIPASLLKRAEFGTHWHWHGYLARGSITLLSALWKAGKTTLIAHLLKTLEEGGTFCGLGVRSGRVLYVTEEHESLWAERRDNLGLTDNVHFLVRPFAVKPRRDRWQAFMGHLREIRERHPYDVLVMDPISNIWPVRDENDAPEVQAALMPLHSIGDDLAILLNHHLRKGDGSEATAARGSGALAAFCDTLLELRRYNPGDRKDRRRVLSGYGRYTETTDELVVELTDDGYLAHGDRARTGLNEMLDVIGGILRHNAGWHSREEVRNLWPQGTVPPGQTRVNEALDYGGRKALWESDGDGKRGSPYRYRVEG